MTMLFSLKPRRSAPPAPATSISRRSSFAQVSTTLVLLLLLISGFTFASENQGTCSAPSSSSAVDSCTSNQSEEPASNSAKMSDPIDYKSATSIYDFTVKDSFGNDVSLEKYRGKVVLIVNIASNCGLTKNNYAQLTQLQQKFTEAELGVLSFPCNQFASQMPEADGEEMVCHLRSAQANVGDVFAKVNVNGDAASPLWKYLKHKLTGTLGIGAIKWNFTKFLIDRNGQPVERFSPTTDPLDIAAKIEKLKAQE